jgi:hypothetical protein
VFEQYHRDLGFDLGWDFARYGRPLDPHSANMDVIAGYNAGKAHFQVAQHTPTRYEAKWLQLRLSAIRRRRIVHPDVTPDYLQRIDCDTCAVTLEPLTHSALTGTDWSIDRINNDGAYAAGNLMVISTRANRAKAARRYSEVAQLARGKPEETVSGLSRPEWARLACLMVGSEEIADARATLTPLLTRIPEDSRVPLYYLFQQFLLLSVRRAANRNHVLKALNGLHPERSQQERIRLASERLAILQKNVSFAYDALADQRVQAFLVSWFTSLPRQSVRGLLDLAAYFGGSECGRSLPASWSLSSRGHFVLDQCDGRGSAAKVDRNRPFA